MGSINRLGVVEIAYGSIGMPVVEPSKSSSREENGSGEKVKMRALLNSR